MGNVDDRLVSLVRNLGKDLAGINPDSGERGLRYASDRVLDVMDRVWDRLDDIDLDEEEDGYDWENAGFQDENDAEYG